jgi:5'-3' exonuclease
MDTMQLVDKDKVVVYTLKKGITDTMIYDEKAVIARYGFKPTLVADFKGLRGDPSDNIIGVRGVGEKTATSLITEFGSIESIYKALENPKNDARFDSIGVKERMRGILRENAEEAVFSKALATIRLDAQVPVDLPPRWQQTLLALRRCLMNFHSDHSAHAYAHVLGTTMLQQFQLMHQKKLRWLMMRNGIWLRWRTG